MGNLKAKDLLRILNRMTPEQLESPILISDDNELNGAHLVMDWAFDGYEGVKELMPHWLAKEMGEHKKFLLLI